MTSVVPALPEGIAVGRVLRPWGRHGAVVVEPLTHDPRRFERLERVTCVAPGSPRRTRTVAEVRVGPDGRPVLRLEGCESIADAEALRGARLEVDPGEVERPPADAYFHHELAGCRVVSVTGERLGEVTAVLETGGTALLEVRDHEDEMLIPLSRPLVVRVDVSGREVLVDLPAGLAELNRSGGDDAD